MQQTDYSLVVLTDKQKQIFKKFKKKDSVILTIKEFNTMNGTSLLEQAIDGKSTWFDTNVEQGVCKLSKHGIKYQAYLKEKKREYWKTLLISKWSDIIVSFITALITALATLLLSQ